MSRTNFKELLNAGVHFGHLKRKWNPNMAPYIFMERNGIHILDLKKTAVKIDIAASALKQIAKSGRKILFVATKKQAKEIVSEKIKQINMPYVTERWPGGMLTNFPTIRKTVKKMAAIDKMELDGTFDNLSKREKLQIIRQRVKLDKNFGSIADLTRLPAAMFVVDISKEHIAVREAKRLNIPLFAIVDTNSDPTSVDFPIPANDDASKSIFLIINIMSNAIWEGLEERKFEREKEAVSKEKRTVKKEIKTEPQKPRIEKAEKKEAPVKEEATESIEEKEKSEKKEKEKAKTDIKKVETKVELKKEKAKAENTEIKLTNKKEEKSESKKPPAKKNPVKKTSAEKVDKKE